MWKSELLVVKEQNKDLIRLKAQQRALFTGRCFRWSVEEDVIYGLGLIVN